MLLVGKLAVCRVPLGSTSDAPLFRMLSTFLWPGTYSSKQTELRDVVRGDLS